ncbi:methyltransferase [Niveispirillum sp.]|uniref:tRNA1(Val) (adenine(37)-N6)-methyltransferase n=1 Tax=Niveispirillum sp. TaxID=1917217 RepID=UPI001B78CEB9|nr:methyltransferase [Niveispirillum sp.]MBP7336930.1 methyltransferase [Niveispirillum sp.]
MTGCGDIDRTALLGGRVTLFQPIGGYRAAIDPVLLAAAVPARVGEAVLELGCGTGAALLCLAARVPGLSVTGVEIQAMAAALARRSAAESGLGDRVSVLDGDIAALSPDLRPNSFDQVISNPPFWPAGRHTPSPSTHKAVSHGEGSGDLAMFVQAALRLLKSRGRLTLIYPAERLDHLLSLLTGRFGDIRILPLWPRAGQPARRVIVTALRDARGALSLLPGLVLHGPEQAYTPQVDAILRDAAALPV